MLLSKKQNAVSNCNVVDKACVAMETVCVSGLPVLIFWPNSKVLGWQKLHNVKIQFSSKENRSSYKTWRIILTV